jgi:putative NADPH-quinone reductase
MIGPKKILVIAAHPTLQKAKVNRALADAVRDLPGVTLRDLYALYPDYRINVAEEQRLLAEHDALVFQFPLYWYSTPALLKLWQDEVLSWGFAHGPNGTVLQGKRFLCVLTAGSHESLYRPDGRHQYSLEEFLRPLQQTMTLCGMTWETPFALLGAQKMKDSEVEAKVAELRARIRGLFDERK